MATTTTRLLHMTLISAEDLKDVNDLFKMDLYAVATLSCDPFTQRTDVDCDCGANPTWNCPIGFNIPEDVDRDTLSVRVLIRTYDDYDVGVVDIPIMALESGDGHESKFVSYNVKTLSSDAEGVLNLSYKFTNHPMRLLDMTLISAEDLKDVNHLFKMDLYAVATLSCDPRTQRTPIDWDCGKNASWNCPIRFYIPEDVDRDKLVVHVDIRCFKVGNDRDVGEVRIPMKDLESGVDVSGESKLVSCKVKRPSGRTKGVLKFSYKFNDPITSSPVNVPPVGSQQPPMAAPFPPPTAIRERRPTTSARYTPISGGQQPPMAAPAWYPPTESKIGGPPPLAGYPPAAGPSTAYPAPPPPAGYLYGAPPPTEYPSVLPPQGYGAQPPPPAHGYGAQPPPPWAYGYPVYGASPPAEYPGYSAPPPVGFPGYGAPPPAGYSRDAPPSI